MKITLLKACNQPFLLGFAMHRTDPPASINPSGTVFVVDSDPASLLTLAGALHSKGYKCICARTIESVQQSSDLAPADLLVWDVGDGAPEALRKLESFRGQGREGQSAILLAEHRWAGLERQAESIPQATRVLFKPVDPNVLLALADQLVLTEVLVQTHHRRGTRPSRPGWVKL